LPERSDGLDEAYTLEAADLYQFQREPGTGHQLGFKAGVRADEDSLMTA
jgi:hypothetical protein